MRKNLFIIIAAVLFVFSFIPTSSAAVYTFQPSPNDLHNLDHYYYYVWGIDWTPQPNETVQEATLSIQDLNNWTAEANTLYIHLIDEAPNGVVVGYDGQGQGDNLLYWTQGSIAGPNILLDTYHDTDGSYGLSNPGINYSYSFAANGALDELLLYSSHNGDFSIGFDPDCSYYDDGVLFQIVTSTNTVIPEPASMLLMIGGLLGVFGLRRKF